MQWEVKHGPPFTPIALLLGFCHPQTHRDQSRWWVLASNILLSQQEGSIRQKHIILSVYSVCIHNIVAKLHSGCETSGKMMMQFSIFMYFVCCTFEQVVVKLLLDGRSGGWSVLLCLCCDSPSHFKDCFRTNITLYWLPHFSFQPWVPVIGLIMPCISLL